MGLWIEMRTATTSILFIVPFLFFVFWLQDSKMNTEEGNVNPVRMAALKLAKEIVWSGRKYDLSDSDDEMLDRMFYIAFRIEEYILDIK